MTTRSPTDESIAEHSLRRWRTETPGCSNVNHLNNAGASLPTVAVLDATIAHLQLEAAIGGYEAADRAADKIAATYAAVASLVGAETDEIALVENATRAWDMAFYSIPFRPGDTIVTCVAEYASNYLPYLHVEQTNGVTVLVAPDDEHGQVDVDALAQLVDERTRLVSITHVPTNGGLVNPAAEIGRVSRAAGVLYLLDACQSVGQLRVDVEEIGCDFLSVTGRKFLRAPRGTGFLYARRDTTEALHPPFIDLRAASWTANDRYELHPTARRFENWESNVAARIGLGVAATAVTAIGIDVISERIGILVARLRAGLTEIDGITIHDKGARRSAIVTVSHQRIVAAELCDRLREQHINTSVSGAASTRLDFEQRGLPDLLRISPHYFNTIEEIDDVLDLLTQLTR